MEMKRHHLPPVLFLHALALLSLALGTARFADGDQILGEAGTLLANASVSTFLSLGNHHLLPYLCVPCHSKPTSAPWQRTVSWFRVPFHDLPNDDNLLTAFCGFLLTCHRHRHRGDVAGTMADLPALLDRRRLKAQVWF
jgi:hypothetical protein